MNNWPPSPQVIKPTLATRAAAELELRRRAANRERWRNDPVTFAREALGIEPWSRQEDILRAVAESPRVAVRSGHKVSKSTSASILGHWWAYTRPGSWTVMTSSSGRQVKAILWEEFRKRWAAGKTYLGPSPAVDPNTGFRTEHGSRVNGFSTDEPERMAGISGADVLFIVDEASGVPEPIFEAIEGNRAGGARLVMFSNPTQTSGSFYDAFHGKRDLYRTLTISSEESPNVTEGRIVIPGLATREWIDEKRTEWGEDSPIYGVRVKGEFPRQGSNAVVALTFLTQAQDRYDETEPTGDLEIGVDPSRYGEDEAAIAARRGSYLYPLRCYLGLDGIQLAARVVEMARELRTATQRRVRVKVDVIGVGASCADQLKHHADLIELVEVNVSNRSDDPERYHALRDQLWFAAADWLKEGGALPHDDRLASELVAPLYKFDAQGRYQVESKDETKKRLKRSPNRADAVCLAIYRAKRAAVLDPADVADAGDGYRMTSRGF